MNGSMVTSFKEKAEEGTRFFHSMFREPRGHPIQEILQVISKFPTVFSEEMNHSLCEEALEVKVQESLFSTQKRKSPRPDGLII
jgi:hypothetical protein